MHDIEIKIANAKTTYNEQYKKPVTPSLSPQKIKTRHLDVNIALNT